MLKTKAEAEAEAMFWRPRPRRRSTFWHRDQFGLEDFLHRSFCAENTLNSTLALVLFVSSTLSAVVQRADNFTDALKRDRRERRCRFTLSAVGERGIGVFHGLSCFLVFFVLLFFGC